MNVFVFVLSLVAVVMTAETIKKIYQINAEKSARKDDVGKSQAQLDALEERIRVLERIVTEKRFDLKREIDRL